MADAASLRAVVAACLDGYAQDHRLSPRRWQVCRHVRECRTAALGGFALRCDPCGEPARLYHACRDRHCPRCQRRASEAWCERQRAAVLPVTYHHLVFTLPHALNGWIRLHPRLIYGLLFKTVWQTLSAFSRDPKRLGGELAMTAVLHTWGQTLRLHPHVHCVIPGGGLAADGTRWVSCRTPRFFLSVRVLQRLFRGKLLALLQQARQALLHAEAELVGLAASLDPGIG